MAACNKDNGRWHGQRREARVEMTTTGQASLERVRIARYNPTGETPSERQERHARETGTSRMLWL